MGRQRKGLWEHSLACALLSRRLARETGFPEPEETMIAGLLHDLGKVAFSFLFPDEYESACGAAEERRIHISEAEYEVFQVDHAQVGSWVAREWHFPARLADAITCHHHPDLAKNGGNATAVVHVADVLARALGFGTPGDPTLPPFDRSTFQGLGIPFTQLPSIFEEVEAEFAGGVSFLGST